MVLIPTAAAEPAVDYVATHLQPLLTTALVELCKAKPEDPRTWLAEYLLANKPAPEVKPLTVDLVLVLGLEVSGSSELCEALVESTGCVHLELQSLIKGEIESGSSLGSEISVLIQQGKVVPKETCASLVKAALADASPGTTYLLEGYPTSAATLKSMGELIGYTPKLALLCELTEEQAVPKLEEAGSPRPAALQKMASFNMHSKGMLAELSTMGILTKIDASEGPEACLAAARAAIQS